MIRVYVKNLCLQAVRQTMSDVVPHSPVQIAVRFLVIAGIAASFWFYVKFVDVNSAVYNDFVLGLFAVAAATGAAVIVGLIINLIFRAPYQLWTAAKTAINDLSLNTGVSDISAWQEINIFTLADAACLWNGIAPSAEGAAAPPSVSATVAKLRQALEKNQLEPANNAAKIGISIARTGMVFADAKPISLDTKLKRKDLIEYAHKIGERPQFLFGETQASQKDVVRRRLISNCREILADFDHTSGVVFKEHLEYEKAYFEIRPHLSGQFLDSLKPLALNICMDGLSDDQHRASDLADELDRLEKKWNLI